MLFRHWLQKMHWSHPTDWHKHCFCWQKSLSAESLLQNKKLLRQIADMWAHSKNACVKGACGQERRTADRDERKTKSNCWNHRANQTNMTFANLILALRRTLLALPSSKMKLQSHCNNSKVPVMTELSPQLVTCCSQCNPTSSVNSVHWRGTMLTATGWKVFLSWCPSHVPNQKQQNF